MGETVTGNDPPPHAPSGEQPDLTVEESVMNDAPPQRIPKRRTKTGCLTCRQRRIKCGEEKPICNNCIKSKRECKGYAQRVIFKNPMGIDGTFGSNASSNDNAQIQQPGYHSQPLPHQQDTSRPMDTQIRQPFVPGLAGNSVDGTNLGPSTAPFGPPAQIRHAPQLSASAVQPTISPATAFFHQQLQELSPALPHGNGSRGLGGSSAGSLYQNPAYQQSGHVRNVPPVPPMMPQAPTFTGPVSQPFSSWNPDPGTFPFGHTQGQQPLHYTHVHPLQPGPAPQVPYVDNHGDNYYDLDFDEEPTGEHGGSFGQLSLIMNSANRDERQLRSFATHLNEPNILSSYRPSMSSSPLNNPKTARLFAHFVHSIGPALSVFERHPVDASIVLGAPVPAARQGLWTYTLPLQALEHQALLHAMLAMSSLHISFLQQAPRTVSLKHYHYALKRVGGAVGLPTRRQQYGTLAATLLLGYYEVVAADHSKWNSHVAGSGQLVREIDFARLTRDLRAHRRRVRAQREQMTRSSLWFASNFGDDTEDDPFAEKEEAIDQNLIGFIIGKAINYDEFGQVEEGPALPYQKHFTRKDIENLRVQIDLYWWYCKQDTLQSIISGNQLFMPYYQWGQCPPRAGMGRLDAIYGSADHLWLLLGRLTDFSYRDRKRKLKAAKAAGTDWRLNPGFFKFMARFASGSSNMRGAPPRAPAGPANNSHGPQGPSGVKQNIPQPSGNTSNSTSGGSPPMYGMVPPRGPVRLPPAFANTPHQRNPSGQDDDDDDGGPTYNDAENEWESILAAFDAFAQALGRDFMPLSPDMTPPISTPFGPALQYRTHNIAVLWGFYYTGRTVLLRVHPSMPPAMMVAAGAGAAATAECAQTIGKIAAGIYNPQLLSLDAGSLSPTLGSCLIEMTVPIFFAAVQYTDPTQRNWSVTSLRTVSRLTGWKSSDTIAGGCERSWVVAAKQGRGPPYEPSETRQSSVDPSLQQRSDGHSQPDYNIERRFVTVSRSTRSHWAMGILSLEDDISNLEINDRV